MLEVNVWNILAIYIEVSFIKTIWKEWAFSTCESLYFTCENSISGEQGSGWLKFALSYLAGLTAGSTSALQQSEGLLSEGTTVVPAACRIWTDWGHLGTNSFCLYLLHCLAKKISRLLSVTAQSHSWFYPLWVHLSTLCLSWQVLSIYSSLQASQLPLRQHCIDQLGAGKMAAGPSPDVSNHKIR